MNDKFGFDMDGREITLAEYMAKTKADPHWRRVAETMVGERRVSTVLLSIDHGFGGMPLIFETMTFPDQSVQERYHTKTAALEGHAEIVKQCEAEAQAERAK